MRFFARFIVLGLVALCSWVGGWKAMPRVKALIVESDQARYARVCGEIAGGKNAADTTVVASPLARTADVPVLMAHAGAGGEIFYANTPEACDKSIAKGFRILEVDVSITSDGVPVMSHCFQPNGEIVFDRTPTAAEFLATKVCGTGTPMTLADFLNRYEGFDGYLCVDQSAQCRGTDFDLIGFLEKTATAARLKRIIYQAYTLDELKRLQSHNPFGFVHYCLGREAWDASAESSWGELIPALKTAGVTSVSFGDMPIDDRLGRLVSTFKAAGFAVSVANVNSLARAKRWVSLGVDCFDTDFLTPEMLGASEW